jgi:hypothetical protein
VVRGRWAADPLGRLTADQINFLVLFVRSRGNLSDVERTLGVSYPTVRAKLDELIAALTSTPSSDSSPAADRLAAPSARQAVLEQVAAGQLSIDEALARLRATAPRKED